MRPDSSPVFKIAAVCETTLIRVHSSCTTILVLAWPLSQQLRTHKSRILALQSKQDPDYADELGAGLMSGRDYLRPFTHRKGPYAGEDFLPGDAVLDALKDVKVLVM